MALFSVKQPFMATATHHKWFTAKPILSRNHRLLPCTVKMSLAGREPLFSSVTTYAPATIAHFGSSFETLGCAVEGMGDFVTLKMDPNVRAGELSLISDIILDYKQVQEALSGIASSSMGLSLSIKKGVPTGVGLGSTAATITAAVLAVNEMFGGNYSRKDLIPVILETMSRQAYRLNLVPAMVGNFVGYNPGPRGVQTPFPWGLAPLTFPATKPIWFVLVVPEIEGPMPSVEDVIYLRGRGGDVSDRNGRSSDREMYSLMLAGLERGDLYSLGYGMSNNLSLETILYSFIPGFYSVKEAAIGAGAFGFCISGAGPTVVALTDDEAKGRRIGEQMVEAFRVSGGLSAVALVRTLDRFGAKVVTRVSK